jgi:spoIIIJ-associated protein
MQKEEVKQWIEKTLSVIPIEVTDIKIESDQPNVFVFSIETPEGHLLLGNNPEGLHALNHLLRRMIEKKTPTPESSFIIDINGFRKKIEEKIRGVGKMLGERALSLKSEVAMEPMGSFERRVVHALFQDHPNISTESKGFGKNRYVTLRYVEKKDSKNNNEEESFV